jgi:MYXO-CTERM domain-containing protein
LPGTQPPPGPGTTSDGAGHRSRWWWGLVALAAVTVLVLLVVEPWVAHQTEPAATGSLPSVADVPAVPPQSEQALTRVPVPGEDAVFDATTMASLFVTPTDLMAGVPAAAGGLRPGLVLRDDGWGLPEGSTVVPASCTTAVTVVADEPDEFGTRSLLNDELAWDQQVALLSDSTAAGDAFADLVETVDACPTYVQAGPVRTAWVAEPALEGPDAFPSIVQVVTRTSAGVSAATYHGHMLVGNTIVTWTATSLAAGASKEVALATLGDATSLNAMVQARALQAVEKAG